MATTSRKDIDAEMVAWLAAIKAEHAEADAYADLWLACHDAEAIPDKLSPAARDAHAKIDAALDAIVGR